MYKLVCKGEGEMRQKLEYFFHTENQLELMDKHSQ